MAPENNAAPLLLEQQLQLTLTQIRNNETASCLRDMDDAGVALLNYAAGKDEVEAILWLAYAGIPINAIDTKNRASALLVAIQQRHWRCADILLCLSADKQQNLNLLTHYSSDELYHEIQNLAIDPKLFKALLYWAISHYRSHEDYGLRFINLLAHQITLEHDAAISDEIKSSELDTALLTHDPLTPSISVHHIWRDVYCLAKLATKNHHPELAHYLKNLLQPSYTLTDQDAATHASELFDNYVAMLASALTTGELNEMLTPSLSDVGLISQPSSPVKTSHHTSSPYIPNPVTLQPQVQDFLQALDQELHQQSFWRARRWNLLTNSSILGMTASVLAAAIMVPSLLASNYLDAEYHSIRRLMATTSHGSFAPHAPLYCDALFDSKSQRACRNDIDLGNCAELCQALTDINKHFFWLLTLGILSPAGLMLFALPLVLTGLHQVSNILSQDVSRFNDWTLQDLSIDLQMQAAALFDKLNTDEERLNLRMSLGEIHATLTNFNETYRHIYQLGSKLPALPTPAILEPFQPEEEKKHNPPPVR